MTPGDIAFIAEHQGGEAQGAVQIARLLLHAAERPCQRGHSEASRVVAQPLIHSPTYSLSLCLPHSTTHSPTDPPTHSLNHSPT